MIGDHRRNLVISLRSGNRATINGVEAWRLTPPQKNSQCKNPLKKFSPRFFGIKTTSSSLIISSKGPNYQRGVLLISAGGIEGHFEGKTPRAGRSPRRSCSCTTIPRLTGHLQPRRNWPTWASSVLITQPIVRIWPRRTTTCSLD